MEKGSQCGGGSCKSFTVKSWPCFTQIKMDLWWEGKFKIGDGEESSGGPGWTWPGQGW